MSASGTASASTSTRSTLLWELDQFHKTKNAELHRALQEFAQAHQFFDFPEGGLDGRQRRRARRGGGTGFLWAEGCLDPDPNQAHEEFGLKSYDQWRNPRRSTSPGLARQRLICSSDTCGS